MPQREITVLLDRWGKGDRGALDELLPLVYAELKQIAAAYLRNERANRTLQTTALVHEAYLRLAAYRQPRFENRKHFFAVAAQAVRRILVDQARSRGADKRDPTVSLQLAMPAGADVDLLDLDRALDRLEADDPEKVRIVELRYFAGLTVIETAELTGRSPATVKRDWAIAKAWLFRALNGGADRESASVA